MKPFFHWFLLSSQFILKRLVQPLTFGTMKYKCNGILCPQIHTLFLAVPINTVVSHPFDVKQLKHTQAPRQGSNALPQHR